MVRVCKCIIVDCGQQKCSQRLVIFLYAEHCFVDIVYLWSYTSYTIHIVARYGSMAELLPMAANKHVCNAENGNNNNSTTSNQHKCWQQIDSIEATCIYAKNRSKVKFNSAFNVVYSFPIYLQVCILHSATTLHWLILAHWSVRVAENKRRERWVRCTFR